MPIMESILTRICLSAQKLRFDCGHVCPGPAVRGAPPYPSLPLLTGRVGPGELHPEAPTEPCATIFRYTALLTDPLGGRGLARWHRLPRVQPPPVNPVMLR